MTINSVFSSILKYSLMVFIGLVIGLGLMELGLRGIGVKPSTYLRKFSQYHEILGWVKSPDVDDFFQRGDVKIHEKLNSKGLRSPEYGYAKPPNTFRILLVGDSFTEGYDVEFEDLFSTVLEKKLSTVSKKLHVEVINTGTGGYSNDQEYLYYLLEGRKYSPDLVIMMMYASNDIYYNLYDRYGNYYKPKFQWKDSSLVLVNTPLPKPPAAEGLKNVLRNFALYQFTLNNVLTRMPQLTRWLSHKGFVAPATAELATNQGSAPQSFGIFARHATAEIDSAWDISKKIVTAFKKSCDSVSSKFILFSIPDKFQVYDDSWKATQENYHVNDSIWDRKGPERILDAYCAGGRIYFINFMDSLHQMPSPLPRLYNGVHWNEAGNQQAAGMLFRTIIGNRFMESVNN